jgi:hypothetical protein
MAAASVIRFAAFPDFPPDVAGFFHAGVVTAVGFTVDFVADVPVADDFVAEVLVAEGFNDFVACGFVADDFVDDDFIMGDFVADDFVAVAFVADTFAAGFFVTGLRAAGCFVAGMRVSFRRGAAGAALNGVPSAWRTGRRGGDPTALRGTLITPPAAPASLVFDALARRRRAAHGVVPHRPLSRRNPWGRPGR